MIIKLLTAALVSSALCLTAVGARADDVYVDTGKVKVSVGANGNVKVRSNGVEVTPNVVRSRNINLNQRWKRNIRNSRFSNGVCKQDRYNSTRRSASGQSITQTSVLSRVCR